MKTILDSKSYHNLKNKVKKFLSLKKTLKPIKHITIVVRAPFKSVTLWYLLHNFGGPGIFARGTRFDSLVNYISATCYLLSTYWMRWKDWYRLILIFNMNSGCHQITMLLSITFTCFVRYTISLKGLDLKFWYTFWKERVTGHFSFFFSFL